MTKYTCKQFRNQNDIDYLIIGLTVSYKLSV